MRDKCPIPACQALLKPGALFCKVHKAMAFPQFLIAFDEADKRVRNRRLEQWQRDDAKTERRRAAALAFASVCEKLGIDPVALMNQKPKQRIAQAVKRALNG